jgi:SAM-dependent methyltransferase
MSLRKKLVLIFVSNTFHHLPDPSSYFVHIRHALRPEGRVAIIEVSSGSFPKGHDTKPKDIQEQMQAAAFAWPSATSSSNARAFRSSFRVTEDAVGCSLVQRLAACRVLACA